MNEAAIRDRLVELGLKVFQAKKQPSPFIKDNPEANALLNNLDEYPHAFVLGCVMDRQVEAEKAWVIPYLFSQEVGGFSMARLSQLSLDEVSRIMLPLHWLHRKMSPAFYSAIRHINNQYGGDASRIWTAKPSSAEAVCVFLSSMESARRSRLWQSIFSHESSKFRLPTTTPLTFRLIGISAESLVVLDCLPTMLRSNK